MVISYDMIVQIKETRRTSRRSSSGGASFFVFNEERRRVNEKNPDKCSVLLEKYFKKDVQKIHHRLVLFGRYYCKAIKPKCDICELKSVCKFYSEVKNVSR